MDRGPQSHIYIDGYGFVSEAPWIRENRSLRRTSFLIAFLLLLIFVLNTVFYYPATAFMAVLFEVAGWKNAAIYAECRELLTYLAAFSVVTLLAFSLLAPPKEEKSVFKAPSARIAVDGAVMTLGVWAALVIVSDWSKSLLQKIRILELTPDYLLPSAPGAMVLYLLRLTLIPAILEEFLFRGAILRALRRFGDGFAIAGSAAVFGAIHYSFTRDVEGFVLGLALGYFVVRSGSVWTAVLSRFAVLSASMVMKLSGFLLTAETAGLFPTVFLILALAAGAAAFIFFCRRDLNAFILSAGHSALPTGKKLRLFFLNPPMIAALLIWAIQAVMHIQLL